MTEEKRKHINTKGALAYAFMPQLGRRIKNLSINTQWIALMLAQIFYTVRILPAGHPYLISGNASQVSLRGVLAEAANNLKFDLKHTDQLIIYGIMLFGLVLLVMQFVLLATVLTTNVAHAQFTGFFSPPIGMNVQNDIAHGMLDQIFGIPGLFGSRYDPAIIGGIPPFTLALHETFGYYNFAMSTVAAFLVVYFIFVILVESVQDGTPFGKRFASGYVPLRLIIALAFLVPTYYNFSTGQHLVLNVAKIGSHFATNTWMAFARTVENPIGVGANAERVLPVPNQPRTDAFIEAMLLANICAIYHRTEYMNDYTALGEYFIETPVTIGAGGAVTSAGNLPDGGGDPRPINLFLLYDDRVQGNKTMIVAETPDFANAYYTNVAGPAINDVDTYLEATDGKEVRVRFGRIGPDLDGFIPTETGPVIGRLEPTCGELLIPKGVNPSLGPATIGTAAGQVKYFNLVGIQIMWYNGWFSKIAHRLLAIEGIIPLDPCDIPVDFPASWPDCKTYPPPTYYEVMFGAVRGVMVNFFNSAATLAQTEIADLISTSNAGNPENQQLFEYGWAGAGMWYNRLSNKYGAYKELFAAPVIKSYPLILGQVAEAKRSVQEDARGLDLFNPELPEGGMVTLPNQNDVKLAKIMHDVLYTLSTGQFNQITLKRDESNWFVNKISQVFGLEGIFNMRENGDVHPFGQLVAAGKGLMDSSISAFAGTIFATSLSGFLSSMGAETVSKVANFASQIEAMVATVGLTAGIIMYYVIPLTPFMYFFLAAGRWVKSIFEAMIAVPLWAMAHIRIDGTGLPGVAGNGYFLVFEIFLRPVLTLFGLLASITTYGALMVIFNDIFDLVVDNLANNYVNPAAPAGETADYIDSFRGSVDMIFYTVLYAIIAYMMAMASFKLIDLIPDSILRWMGAGVKSFSDESGNIAEGLNRTLSIQGKLGAGQVVDTAKGIGQAGGFAAGAIGRGIK